MDKKDPVQTLRKMLAFNAEGKCVNAFLTLSDPTVLQMAYETIKSKAGNMVKGTDDETLDGISVK